MLCQSSYLCRALNLEIIESITSIEVTPIQVEDVVSFLPSQEKSERGPFAIDRSAGRLGFSSIDEQHPRPTIFLILLRFILPPPCWRDRELLT